MKKILYALMITSGAVLMVSCGGKDKKADPAGDEGDEEMSMTTGSVFQFASYEAPGDTAKHFGRTIDANGAVNAKNLASDPGKADGFEGKVTGKVVGVCQAKGCWMTLDTGNGTTMMVTFKDYGFFVPKDITGKTVTVQGVADMRTVSVDEQKHLAGDAGKSQSEIDAIKDPKTELRFVADGVVIQ